MMLVTTAMHYCSEVITMDQKLAKCRE